MERRQAATAHPENRLEDKRPSAIPNPSSILGCSGCQVLREIIHTKGMHAMNLEIHGRYGRSGVIITHAIQAENQFVNGNWTKSKHYHMIDFSNKSPEAVKNSVIEYCELRKQDGYTMQQDPFRSFYEALCVGLTPAT